MNEVCMMSELHNNKNNATMTSNNNDFDDANQ